MSVLEASNNATAAAQSLFDSSDAADPASVQLLMGNAIDTVLSVSGSSDYALFREPGQPTSSLAAPDRLSPRLAGVISPELRRQVQENPGSQYWQSVELPNGDGGTDPGIVVGSNLDVPAPRAATSCTSATTWPRPSRRSPSCRSPDSSEQPPCSPCSARSRSSSCAA